MTKFELVLKNEKTRIYQKLALFIILLSLAIFCLLAFYTNNENTRSISISAPVIILGFFILKRFVKNRKSAFEVEPAGFLIISGAWAIMGYWWPAAIFFILLVLYKISQRRLISSINTSWIEFPSFPKKMIDWSELNNIILKDDILTIDFKNNKIIQQLIDKKEPSFDEREFNDFCKVQLRKSSKPSSDDNDSYDGFTEMLNAIQ